MGYTSCRNQSKIEIKSIKISFVSIAVKYDFENRFLKDFLPKAIQNCEAIQ